MRHIKLFESFVTEDFSTDSKKDVDAEMQRLGFELKKYDEKLEYTFSFSGDISGDYMKDLEAWIHPSNQQYGIIFHGLVYRGKNRVSVSDKHYGGFDIVDLKKKELVFQKKSPKTLTGKTTGNFIKSLRSAISKFIKISESLLNEEDRSISDIASEIYADWKKVSPYAAPYLEAMLDLDKITDMYMADSASEIVGRFLGNASSWKGEKAKAIKKELNDMLKRYYNTNEAKNIKDLDKYLTQKSGLDKDERAQWRETINMLRDKANAEKDPKKAKELKDEVLRVFQSMSYWKQKYQKK